MSSTTLPSSVLKAKFRGCMIGVLVGDCLGVPFEFEGYMCNNSINIILPTKKRLCNFMIDLMNEEATREFCYTDDTAMTINVASSLIEKNEINARDMAEKFVAAYFKEDRGYGSHVRLVFHKLKDSKFSDIFKPASEQFNGTGSFGNGAPMRIAPIALFGFDKDEEYIMNAAKECSLVTHAHPNGYRGGILQCLAVHSALRLDPSQEFDPINFIGNLLEKMDKLETEEEKPYCESLKKMKDFFVQNREDISPEEIASVLGNGDDVSALKSVPTAIYSFLRSTKPLKISEFGLKPVRSNVNSFLKVIPSENYFELMSALKSVPTAIYSFLRSTKPLKISESGLKPVRSNVNSFLKVIPSENYFEITNPFMKTIFFAVSVGGDTDTIGAMAGALAGAYYGEDMIPDILQNQCEAFDDIVCLADKLYNVACQDK